MALTARRSWLGPKSAEASSVFRGARLRDLCESAKRGKVCIDDLCHGADITLCGFDKEMYDELVAEGEEDQFRQDDEDDPCQH